ncbi:hypothetical protein I79_021080 [Cricetulus griseus]|uniref:Uncharacterized protein n=1 Tax=Cricetulus griseus TaxID=10029 RepID=G3IBP9_CRIGR|nr:hypothetical protein I79_021080 [Cricetulus griseus]
MEIVQGQIRSLQSCLITRKTRLLPELCNQMCNITSSFLEENFKIMLLTLLKH